MKRPLVGFFLIGTLVIIVAAAFALPFVFESQTLWYKTGIDKTMLRVGQLAGLSALLSLFVQILLGVRGKVLEQAFTVATIMAWHRANGLFLCGLIASHLILVLVPEGIANVPIGAKHWPEMVGGVLFLVLVSQAISSLFRQKFGFIYKKWRMVHRVIGYLALCMATVHVLFVADSFAQGVPKRALLVAVAAVSVSILSIKMSTYFNKIRDKR